MNEDVTVTSADVQPTGRPNKRMRQTVGDMVRSMAVVLAVVAAIWLLAWRPDPEPVKVVDTSQVVTLATMQAEFPVQAPAGLPTAWRATSARWEPTAESATVPVLHLGYVTPTDAYGQVTQSTARSDRYLGEQTAQGEPAGSVDIDGTTWQTYETGDRRSLVRDDGTVLTVVSGSAEWPELTALAASLRPAPAPAAG
jgi:hypothetical protein